MSDRTSPSRSIEDSIIELQRRIKVLESKVPSTWRTNGYTLINTGSGLVIHNTTTLVDTPIAP